MDHIDSRQEPSTSAVVRKAFSDSLPVLMGYTTMGFAAGVLLAVKGNVPFAPFWAAFTSATCVSGTLQFLIVEPLSKLAPLTAIVLLTLAINFRYAFYGFAFIGKWKGVPFFQKLFLVNMLTDENFALEAACKYENHSTWMKYCYAISAFNMSYWVLGVTSGAIAGVALPIPSKGIEFTMVALFLVILTDQIRSFIKK